mmetsp:Transcript_22270/g.24767  ORF Transcript_22270/g.24767 Transcript_22270/m.24767 type:complete len:188 (-) Transcript_22270:99-662(-)
MQILESDLHSNKNMCNTTYQSQDSKIVSPPQPSPRPIVPNRIKQLRISAKWMFFMKHVLYKHIVGERIRTALVKADQLNRDHMNKIRHQDHQDHQDQNVQLQILVNNVKEEEKDTINLGHLQSLESLDKKSVIIEDSDSEDLEDLDRDDNQDVIIHSIINKLDTKVINSENKKKIKSQKLDVIPEAS